MLDKQWKYLDNDGITIKIILGNLIEEKTFQVTGHMGFLQDTYVTVTDKTDLRAPTKPEYYWIHTLKTKTPMGLNVEGGY